MPASQPMPVIFCWHMHQPEYRDLRNGDYQAPWTYLHAIKDYTDMAAHLEANPGAAAVVNFAPVLLDQLQDYAQQLDDYLDNSGAIRDPLLAALAEPTLPTATAQRMALLRMCLRASETRIIQRFAPFKRLATLAIAGRMQILHGSLDDVLQHLVDAVAPTKA